MDLTLYQNLTSTELTWPPKKTMREILVILSPVYRLQGSRWCLVAGLQSCNGARMEFPSVLHIHRAHTNMYTCTHAHKTFPPTPDMDTPHIPTCLYTCAHMNNHIPVHIHIITHLHTCTHMHPQTHKPKPIHRVTNIHTYTQYTCIQAHIYTHHHRYHTHTHSEIPGHTARSLVIHRILMLIVHVTLIKY